uniref:Uncharacterized protein n=1 Tax=Amphimedon queenslandica TaxID=400682 RepID=A0A1X7TK17_AMPQE
MLANRPGIRINPDLSASDRKVKHILLHEQRSILNSGAVHGPIKFGSNCLYVDGRRNGVVRNNTFELCSDSFTLEDHHTSDHHTSFSGDVSKDVPEDPNDTVNLNSQPASSRPLSVSVPHSSSDPTFATNMASTSAASQSSR